MERLVGKSCPLSGCVPKNNNLENIPTGFGPHLMLDLSDCNSEKLNDYSFCFKLLYDLPDQVGMTRITQPYVFPYSGLVPEDEGITGFVVIAESHISIHTFPKKKYAFIDAFSCKDFNVDGVKSYFIDAFESKKPEIFYIERGLKFPRGNILKPEGNDNDCAA